MSSANKLPISVPYVSTGRDSGFATPRGWEQCAAHRRQSPSKSPTCVTKRREGNSLDRRVHGGTLNISNMVCSMHSRLVLEFTGASVSTMGCSTGTTQSSWKKMWCQSSPMSSRFVTTPCAREYLINCQDTALVLRLATSIIVLFGRRQRRGTANEFSHGGRLLGSRQLDHNKNKRNALEQNTLRLMAKNKLLELVVD